MIKLPIKLLHALPQCFVACSKFHEGILMYVIILQRDVKCRNGYKERKRMLDNKIQNSFTECSLLFYFIFIKISLQTILFGVNAFNFYQIF